MDTSAAAIKGQAHPTVQYRGTVQKYSSPTAELDYLSKQLRYKPREEEAERHQVGHSAAIGTFAFFLYH